MKVTRVPGSKFGKLTILERAGYGENPNNKVLYFKCQCECGNIHVVRSSHLNDKSSCGCVRKIREDFTGKQIKEFTVLKLAERGDKHDMWECLCSCGNIVVKSSTYLRHGRGSCGHDIVYGKHQHAHAGDRSPEYTVWYTMVQRCTNPRNAGYAEYGAVGITVCDRWLVQAGGSFENFLEDMGERPEGTSIDRIDGTKGYYKENCRWASNSLQGYNQKKRCTNTSGKTGVSWNKRANKWEAHITLNRKRIHLGVFDSLDSAISARKSAELKYFGFNKE